VTAPGPHDGADERTDYATQSVAMAAEGDLHKYSSHHLLEPIDKGNIRFDRLLRAVARNGPDLSLHVAVTSIQVVAPLRAFSRTFTDQ